MNTKNVARRMASKFQRTLMALLVLVVLFGSMPIRMAQAADLDDDGLMDIVAIDEQTGVALYFGKPGSVFSDGISIGDKTIVPYALAVADLNLDRKIDIIVGNVEARSMIYFNDGPGRKFTSVRFGDNKGAVYGFDIADFDRDGFPDIAVARSDAPNMIYFGTPGTAHAP